MMRTGRIEKVDDGIKGGGGSGFSRFGFFISDPSIPQKILKNNIDSFLSLKNSEK